MATPERVRASRFEVTRRTSGVVVKMSRGNERWEEPRQFADIRDTESGRLVASVGLNSSTMCLPEGGIRGVDATDEQIIRAVMGDEDIFTGAPTFEDVS